MGTCCDAFDQNWILFFIHVTFTAIAPGACQLGRSKCALGWLHETDAPSVGDSHPSCSIWPKQVTEYIPQSRIQPFGDRWGRQWNFLSKPGFWRVQKISLYFLICRPTVYVGLKCCHLRPLEPCEPLKFGALSEILGAIRGYGQIPAT